MPTPHPWTAVRRNVVTDYYDPPAALQAEADDLFARMDALAAECADQGEFETRLAASPLTQQYNDLLARLGPHFRKDPEQEAALQREQAKGRRQNVIDNVKRQTRSAVLHELNNRLPIDDYKWGEPWYYAIPVVGPILKRFFGTVRQVRSLQTYVRRVQPEEPPAAQQDGVKPQEPKNQ
ncbi:MAG: hypothetical protein J6M53_09180 [Bacteroidaceae bacterium]|nr:hypothetical protein [Bacteroidaceae bacterium]